jgi:hypothetical protein
MVHGSEVRERERVTRRGELHGSADLKKESLICDKSWFLML